MLREVRPGRWPDEGGIAGALAYDAARPGRGSAHAEADRARRRSLPGRGGRRRVGRRRRRRPLPVGRRARRAARAHGRRPPRPSPSISPAGRASPATSTAALVRVVQEHIARRGHLPGQPLAALRAAVGRGRAAPSTRRCGRISPAPFAGYLRAGGLEIVSASPERLLSVRRRRAPPRGPSPARARAPPTPAPTARWPPSCC